MRKLSSTERLAEQSRLRSLRSYRILDTVSEKEYDNITKIAAGICQVPVLLLTLLDANRQWFKSSHGFQITELPREIAFCNYLMKDPQQVLVVPDLREDQRFSGNPLVAGEPNVVFYAGAALLDPQGQVLGSICVYDSKSNDLNDDQQAALTALASQVMGSLELRKKMLALQRVQSRLKTVNRNLRQFAHVVSHDLKTPLASISMLTSAVENTADNALHAGNRDLLQLIQKNASHLQSFIDQVLEESATMSRTTKRTADTNQVLQTVKNQIGSRSDVTIEVEEPLPRLAISKTALHQILQNLLTNAVKYNDKDRAHVHISAHSGEGYHHVTVSDNGTGIPTEKLSIIFEEHATLQQTDRFGNKGTGIGLATVKRLLTAAGGKITVNSELHKGSVFTISIPQAS